MTKSNTEEAIKQGLFREDENKRRVVPDAAATAMTIVASKEAADGIRTRIVLVTRDPLIESRASA